MARGPKKHAPLPTREALLSYIRESKVPIGKRELTRAFQIAPDDKPAFKELLRQLMREGELDRPAARRFAAAQRLPEIAVVEIEGRDADGEMIARAPDWRGEGPGPRILMAPDRQGHQPVKGERVMARLRHLGGQDYEGQPIRQLGSGGPRELMGIYQAGRRGGSLKAADRTMKDEISIMVEDSAGASHGELVLVALKPRSGRATAQRAGVVIERLGDASNPRALSLIAIHSHSIPNVFPSEALADAEASQAVPLAKRLDLRLVPLITIDGADARDFDDAVFAEADADPSNRGGFRLLVAIADVAHYVTPGSALDREARKRGNSVYFPDRVVPMLPEALSNGWCSLKPKEERGCLVAEMTIDAGGHLKKHRFHRGLMRSAARLTYERVQAAMDGMADDTTGPLLEPVLKPLYAAYRALDKARLTRGTLDLDLVERQVILNAEGGVEAIRPRARLDSHKLIEEFMITANVAAAEALEAKRQPCMYRVHEPPDPVKLEALRQVLEGLNLGFAKGQSIKPRVFGDILAKVAGTDASPIISDLILRSQSQAHYSPKNAGHFGLALTRYAHFTSPIRRYSDLLVHRALIRGYDLGDGGLEPGDEERFVEWGELISQTERRAQVAEREATDRFAALYLSKQIGAILTGRVAAVTRFGLFVRLHETGVDGLIPIRSLPQDYYEHDETHHALIGRRWGRSFHLGDSLSVRLVEADPLIGRLTFDLIEGEAKTSPLAKPPQKRPSGRNRSFGFPRGKKRR